jgi:hypothetical protein
MKKTQEVIDQILQQHKLWIETNGVKGDRAELRHASLIGADLRNANLFGVLLCNADLRDANLLGADLRRVNLYGANLRGARFDTNIRDCSCFLRAKFTPEALPWLILHPKWAKMKDTVRIETE